MSLGDTPLRDGSGCLWCDRRRTTRFGVGDTRLTLAGAIAVNRVLTGCVESLPGDAGRVIDPRLLRFCVATSRFTLLDDVAAGLAQAGIDLM